MALSVLVAGSAFAQAVGSILPRPDQTKQLMRANGFQLKRVQLEPEVKVLVFVYSASWCGPCKLMADRLKEVYPSLREAHPEIEFVTFSVDHTVSERAEYLRESSFPWLAMSPSALDDGEWQALPPKSTPEFQAFEVTDDGLRILTESGAAADVLRITLDFLKAPDTPKAELAK